MPRRIQWSLLLLVVLGFVAPGAAHASGGGGARASVSPALRSSPMLLSPSKSHVPDYAPVVVRSGVDLEDGRSEKGGASKRGLIGTGSTSHTAPPCSSGSRCCGFGGTARSSSSSTVALRAPPFRSA
jgi:hypothetical protein